MVSEALLHPAHPIAPGGQRSFEDVLIRIVFRDDRPSVVQYASPGRAHYMLSRYSRDNFLSKPRQHCYVETVQPGRSS